MFRQMTTRRPLSTTTMAQRDNMRLRQTVSFNIHGFNQGCHIVFELISAISADIFLLQEHWLTPANLCKFKTYFSDYVCFGSSAMNSAVESDVLFGSPYGDVMTLIAKKLQNCSKVVYATDRYYVIVSVGNLIVFNPPTPKEGVKSTPSCAFL